MNIADYTNSHKVLNLRITHEMFYEHISTNEIRIETRQVYPSTYDRYLDIQEDGTYEIKRYDAMLIQLNEGTNPPIALIEITDAEYQGCGTVEKDLYYNAKGEIGGIMIYTLGDVLYVSNEKVIFEDNISDCTNSKRNKSLPLKVTKNLYNSLLGAGRTTIELQITDSIAQKMLSKPESFYAEEPLDAAEMTLKHYDMISMSYGTSKNNPKLQIKLQKAELIAFEEENGTFAVYDTLYENCYVSKIRLYLSEFL